MVTKEEFIKTWTEHINTIGLMAFCSDKELSKKAFNHIEELKDLVRPIADIKEF